MLNIPSYKMLYYNRVSDPYNARAHKIPVLPEASTLEISVQTMGLGKPILLPDRSGYHVGTVYSVNGFLT